MSEAPVQYECSTPEAWTELLRTERQSAQVLIASVTQMRIERDNALARLSEAKVMISDLTAAIAAANSNGG